MTAIKNMENDNTTPKKIIKAKSSDYNPFSQINKRKIDIKKPIFKKAESDPTFKNLKTYNLDINLDKIFTKNNHIYTDEDLLILNGIQVAAIEDIGSRKSMEDTYIIEQKYIPETHVSSTGKLFYLPKTLIGVFDGHSGKDAAQFCRNELPKNISNNWKTKNAFSALKLGFLETEQNFLSEARQRGLSSGATALIVIILGRFLVTAHIGDTRAVLSRDGNPILLTADHTYQNDSEKMRICKEGAFVSGDGRLNGDLLVTRAFGDLVFSSTLEMPTKMKGLSASPEISEYKLQDNDEFIIIASDGLWDVLSPKDAVLIVRRSLRAHNNINVACENLLTHALQNNDLSDNVTVVIVGFSKTDNDSKERFIIKPRKRCIPRVLSYVRPSSYKNLQTIRNIKSEANICKGKTLDKNNI